MAQLLLFAMRAYFFNDPTVYGYYIYYRQRMMAELTRTDAVLVNNLPAPRIVNK